MRAHVISGRTPRQFETVRQSIQYVRGREIVRGALRGVLLGLFWEVRRTDGGEVQSVRGGSRCEAD